MGTGGGGPKAEAGGASFSPPTSILTSPPMLRSIRCAGHYDSLTGRHHLAFDGPIDRNLLAERDNVSLDGSVNRDLLAEGVQVVRNRFVRFDDDLVAVAELGSVNAQQGSRNRG